MLRLLTIAVSTLFLVTCGGGSDGPASDTPTGSAEKATIYMTDYLPWPPKGKKVETTESGLQYIVVREGDTKQAKPAVHDEVVVDYEGRLPNGDVFDSSYERGEPTTFGVGQVIAGWTEGLQLMTPGSVYIFYIPSDLAYGDNPRRGAPAGDLVFKVDLKAVRDTAHLPDLLPWPPENETVQTTESGLQYIQTREGDTNGKTPSARDRVVVHYEGRSANGNIFDSSYRRGRPATFGVTQVISGWTEGLQLMSEGSEFVFYIPADLAYGDSPPPGSGIKSGDDLVFKVELKEVEVAPPAKAVSTETWAAYTPWGKSNEGVTKTDSGLQYVVIESGAEEGRQPDLTDMVIVHYEGRFDKTGEVFDSSFSRGLAADFQPRNVIPGWTEALQLMRPGDRWLLHIPGDLAYGPSGRPPEIPPNSALNFEVELLDVLDVR